MRNASAFLQRATTYGIRLIRSYPCRPIRRRIAVGGARWASRLPDGLRSLLDLEGNRVDPLRVELGGGPYPTPGYVHVDLDPRSRHLEFVSPVWKLPFETGTVHTILAIHVLEHVHPGRVLGTLREWRRILRADGVAEIHVPNASTIFDAFVRGTDETKWALIGSGLFGMYGGPEVRGPQDLHTEANTADHKAIYDFALLSSVLLQSGFAEVEDATGTVKDRHDEAWAEIISHMSLVVRAYSTRRGGSGPH